ncbi:MAG: recombinase RecT [Akkermansia sp.]
MNTENTGVMQVKNSVLVALGNRYSVEPKQLFETIRKTLARDASNEELMAFSIVANEYKLNPFTKEIYAFPAKGGGIVPMVSVDGWLRIINCHPQFDGMEVVLSDDFTACTVTIYRKDTSHPTVITEYLEECRRGSDPWKLAPRRMLRHKAIIQCGRVAFGFGGIYDEGDGDFVSGFEAPRGSGVSAKGDGAVVDPSVLPDVEVELVGVGVNDGQVFETANLL